jgi:dienelactone hydrolase
LDIEYSIPPPLQIDKKPLSCPAGRDILLFKKAAQYSEIKIMFIFRRSIEMKVLPYILLIALAVIWPNYARAAIKTQTVEYKDGNTVLEGFLAYDDALKGKLPAVLIVHEWTGVGPYVKKRAEQLAGLGYVAFAIDIYGKGIRPADTNEAAKQAAIYRGDRQLMRRRALAGLEQVKKYPFVDPDKIAAIGYCFGGGVVLEMARSGADLKGVISFHGNLDTPNPADANNIKAKVLVCHGADDPYVPQEQVTAFWSQMRNTKVDWQLIIYSGAVHGFTNPDNGSDPSKGAAYNKQADIRSWQAMKEFFKEIF